MTGWIIYNGALNSDKIYELVLWLQKTAQSKGLKLIPVKNNELVFYYDSNSKPCIEHDAHLERPEFVISWDKDIPLAKHLELMGIKVYNSSKGIHLCDNKQLMTQAFAHHNLAIPETIFAPMVFSNSTVSDFQLYDRIISRLGLPLIIKEAYGSFGAQVYKVDDKEALIECVKKIGSKPHLFQKYIKYSHGRDVRINIVNNQYITAMMRVSDQDFRANITNGGKAHPYTPSQEEIDLALKASKILELDYSGVDLLFTENGPIICEVNGNPHFKSIYECTGVDVSHDIIDHIIGDLS